MENRISNNQNNNEKEEEEDEKSPHFVVSHRIDISAGLREYAYIDVCIKC